VSAGIPPLPPFQSFLDANRHAVWRLLVSSVGRAEAEDCFQETFISALAAYPKLRPDSNLSAWVMTIAHRKALDSRLARIGVVCGSAACPRGADGRCSRSDCLL